MEVLTCPPNSPDLSAVKHLWDVQETQPHFQIHAKEDQHEASVMPDWCIHNIPANIMIGKILNYLKNLFLCKQKD